MDRERIDNWCEKGIFGLVLGILVIGPLALGGTRLWGFLPLQAMTMGVMALWMLRVWIGPQPKLLWPPICWAVVAFMAYAVVRYCQADIEMAARKELLRVLVYGFLFFAILNNLHRQEYTQVIALTVIFLGMALSVYAVCQFVTKSQHIWWMTNTNYPGRAGGTFIYPNQFAAFLEMLIPLGLCLVLMGRISHLGKIVVGYAVVTMLAGVAVTFSRGGWLVTGGIMVLVCVVLLFQRDYRLKALALLAVVVVCALFVIPEAQLAQEKAGRGIAGAKVDDVRFSIWWSALQMWREHLWWGVGPGHFDYRFSQYRLPGLQMRAGYAHNDYLNTLADWGVAGMALIGVTLALLYGGVWKCWKFVRGARDDFARKKSNKLAFVTGASLGLAAILAHAFVDFTFQLPANAILAVTLMALVSSHWRFATESYWMRAGIVWKCAVTLALLAGLAELGRTGWQETRETVLLFRADKTLPYTYARIAALEKAFAADPKNFDTAYAIGECYKTKSFLSESDNPSALARRAFTWYERAAKLNPYDAYDWMRQGMCLDWIGLDNPGGRPDTTKYYERANELDPNGWFTTANTGWHYVQTGDYAAARTWLERSDSLEWDGVQNELGRGYLSIVEKRLEEAATASSLERSLQLAPAAVK